MKYKYSLKCEFYNDKLNAVKKLKIHLQHSLSQKILAYLKLHIYLYLL